MTPSLPGTLAVAVALGVGAASPGFAFDGFDGVRFLMPEVRDAHLDDPVAAELSDGRVIGNITRVGQPLPDSHPAVTAIHQTHAHWGATSFLRVRYAPQVVDEVGRVRFQVGGVEDVDRNLFDYAHREKRTDAAQAMAATIASADSDWVMFDEPVWGFKGLADPAELPISDALRQRVSSRVGRPIGSVRAFVDDPQAWRAFAIERQTALSEALRAWADAARGSDRKVALNLFPAAMESGAVTGFEIATAMHVLGDAVDQIGIDPYYTLFIEDPRYPGFMLRMLDDLTPRDVPMLGWIDSVDGLLERLAIKTPPPASMKPQIASYLANGCDHLGVWALPYLDTLGTRDAYLDMVRWVRQNQVLYRGNPELLTDTGLYYSNATVASHDFFPTAWSHGTGPFGQYFTALNTYYMATAIQLPLRVVSTPLGEEGQLASKLQGLRRLIVADAVVMADPEVEAIVAWVKGGGELIAIGEPGRLNERMQPRRGGLAGAYGVRLTPATPRQKISFTEAWPADAAVTLDGSNESLFIERYRANRAYAMDPAHDQGARYYPERWPLHIRREPLAPTVAYATPQLSDWAPKGAPGLEADGAAQVLARYDNDEPAVAVLDVGRGRVVHVAPTDWLTRYRDPVARRAARTLFHDILSSQFDVSGADEADLATLELSVTQRRTATERGVIVHLVRHVHDDQGLIPPADPVDEVVVRLTLEAGETVRGVSVFSPDDPVPALEHAQTGRTLTLRFAPIDVYAAALVRVSRVEGGP